MRTRVTAIVKVDAERFVKYRNITNLNRFRGFLNDRFPGWRYANLYDKETRQQIGAMTRNGNSPAQCL